MNSNKCSEIAEWFISQHSDWVLGKRIVSWAGKLGITLNCKGELDESQLFSLFVLAVLWNNKPTFKVKKGEQVFQAIRHDYTLERFRRAEANSELSRYLRSLAFKEAQNQYIFDLLAFIANGDSKRGNVWQEIKKVLELPHMGNRENDIDRLRQLYGIFNPREYKGEAYLTVKTFLIFREMRIQFRESGKYQYNPIICCIPDSRVRNALVDLKLVQHSGRNIDNLVTVSEITAEHFCKNTYELYDLPLFFWHKERKDKKDVSEAHLKAVRGGFAGICPLCASPLVWRKARKTGELYRGCTNFSGGCRWKDRSY